MRLHNSFGVMRVSWIAISLIGISLALASAVGVTASAQTAAPATDKTVEVTPSQKWADTGIDLHVGDLVQVSATTAGEGNQPCDPQGVVGLANAGKLPMESALPGAL